MMMLSKTDRSCNLCVRTTAWSKMLDGSHACCIVWFLEVSSGHQPIKNCDVCWIVWFPHREITSVWWVMSLELKRFEVDLFNVSRQHWGDTNVRANHPEGGCCLMRINGWKGAALYKDKSKRPLIPDLLQAQGRTPTKNIFSYYISDNKPPGSKRKVR